MRLACALLVLGMVGQQEVAELYDILFGVAVGICIGILLPMWVRSIRRRIKCDTAPANPGGGK